MILKLLRENDKYRTRRTPRYSDPTVGLFAGKLGLGNRGQTERILSEVEYHNGKRSACPRFFVPDFSNIPIALVKILSDLQPAHRGGFTLNAQSREALGRHRENPLTVYLCPRDERCIGDYEQIYLRRSLVSAAPVWYFFLNSKTVLATLCR